jgi:hypothetical protein
MDVSGMVRPQGRRPATVFYPFEHPKPTAYVERSTYITAVAIYLCKFQNGFSQMKNLFPEIERKRT